MFILYLGWILSVAEPGRYCSISAPHGRLEMIQSFLLQQKCSLKSVGCLAQRWLACARARWAFSAWLWRWSSCLLPQLVLSCLVFASLPSRLFLELPCSRTFMSASKPVGHYSHGHHGASHNHPLVSPCHVLCPRWGTLYPCSGDAKPWFPPFYRRAKGGPRRVKGRPRVPHLISLEAGFWHSLSIWPPNPKSVYFMAGLSTTFGITHVRDLSGFAFRIARCYLRD